MAIHAPITGATTRAPISIVLDQAARLQIEEEVERLLALLDAADGDPDLEPDGDEQDASYPEAGVARQAVIKGRASGQEDAEQDNDLEDDGDAADGNGSEDDWMLHLGGGAGCPVSDPGGEDAFDSTFDTRPIADPSAYKHHLRRIRRTRCDRIVSRYLFRGERIIEYRLKGDALGAP